MPIVGLVGAAALWTYLNVKKEPKTPAGGGGAVQGINLTTVAGYAILGGLTYYFGKKLLAA